MLESLPRLLILQEEFAHQSEFLRSPSLELLVPDLDKRHVRETVHLLQNMATGT